MLIQSLKQHFPARFPEWMMAGIMATWGAYIVLHPHLFTDPQTRPLFQGLADMVWVTGWDPAGVWGGASLVVGLLRACALFVNGAYARTPLVRLATSFISAFIWTQVAIGLARTGIPNTGLVTYSWLVIVDLASAYRAATDAVLAENNRSHGRGASAQRAGNY